MVFNYYRQLKEKYMHTEHYNNQQNIPELLKAILQQNPNAFRGSPQTFPHGNQSVNFCNLLFYL